MKIPLRSKPSWLTRLGLGLASGLAIIASLAIASLLFTVLLVAGLVLAGWVWWKYRAVLRRARQAAKSDYIEGEYRIEPAEPTLEARRLPTPELTDDPVVTVRKRHHP